MSTARDKWFAGYGAVADPELLLVCFPHAGGTPGFFKDWAALLPPGWKIRSACYPGRQERFAEPLIDAMDPLADGLTAALEPVLDVPLAFFGHSMGAAVAFEVALRLEARHGVRPLRLFVSGHEAPHRRTRPVHDGASDAELLAELRRLGHSGTDLMDDPGLAEIALPILRADYRIVEHYRPAPGARVNCPIMAYTGDQDTDCAPEAVAAWSELTAQGFAATTFPGGHFYLERHTGEVLRRVTMPLRDDLRLRRVLGVRHA